MYPKISRQEFSECIKHTNCVKIHNDKKISKNVIELKFIKFESAQLGTCLGMVNNQIHLMFP